MISLKHILKSLMEASYAELAEKSDDGRKTRSAGLITKYLGTYEKDTGVKKRSKSGAGQSDYGQARTFWRVDSGSKPGKYYNCIVEFHISQEGGLFGIAKAEKQNIKEIHKTLAGADVRVYCNCPDFYWSGIKYNLGPKGDYKGAVIPNQNAGYKEEKPIVTKAPDIRDPKREHVLCKHLLAIKKNIGFNVSSIMKDLKDFDNNIKVNDELARELDDGKGLLSKDIELREVSEKDSRDFVDPIVHTPAVEPEKKEEIKDNTEEVIKDESEPVENENREDNASDIIDEESDNKAEAPEEAEDIPEQNADVSQVKSEEGAADIIDDINTSVKNEESPEEAPEEEGVILEKDKKKSNIPEPNTILHT